MELRLRYLTEDKRGMEILQAVAEKARWQKRGAPTAKSSGATATGRGVAMTRRSGGYAAAIADVEINRSNGTSPSKKLHSRTIVA